MCSIFYNGMFDVKKVNLPIKAYKKSEFVNELNTLGVFDLVCDEDLICKDIEFCSRKYKVNDLIVIKREERDSMEVGLVKIIFVRGSEVSFVIKRYKMKNSGLGFFENSTSSLNYETIKVTQLQDTYPLHIKGTERQFVVVLHHHISFAYT